MKLEDGQIIGFNVRLASDGIIIDKTVYKKPKNEAERMYSDWEAERVENTQVAETKPEAIRAVTALFEQMKVPDKDAGDA